MSRVTPALRIDATGVHFRDLNARLRGAVDNGVGRIELHSVCGQRYIGTDLHQPVEIHLYGTAGNDLASFMDGPHLVVHGNVQDGCGNTMNGGTVVIHGRAGDVTGYSMRGGRIFIRDDVGYRVGIHMKEYEGRRPVIVIGGTTQHFLGEYMAGGICLLFALIGWVWELYKEGTQSVRMLKKLDWATTLFLVGIFIVVGSLASSGAIEFLSLKLGSVLGGNPFLVYSVIIWVSVLFSAFVDNVPYIVAMLPIASLLAVNLGVSETLLTFGLLLGASVGGNITPIGASANIVAVGLAKKQAGEDISFWQFVKIGLPFTISAIVASWLFGWLVWG